MSSILFIVDDLGKGGAEKVTADLANTLADLGHSVTLAVLNGSKDTQAIKSHVQYIDLNISPSFAFGKLWKAKKLSPIEENRIEQLINQQRYDLIILGFHNGYYLGHYLKQTQNVWYWIHGELLEYRPSANIFKRIKENIRQIKHQAKFKRLFHQKNLITVNQDLKLKYQSLLPNSQIRHIANGVSITQKNMTSSLDKIWDVIFVGRLVAIKQIDHAITAFAQSGLKGRMAIVGEGPQKQELMALVQKLNIEDRVDFLGWADDPYPYIQQSKALILTSYYESFGLVLAESLCLGTPVIAYHCSQGVKDILSYQEDMKSFLIDANNCEQLSTQLYRCVNHPYAILQETKNQLSIQHTAQQFLALI